MSTPRRAHGHARFILRFVIKHTQGNIYHVQVYHVETQRTRPALCNHDQDVAPEPFLQPRRKPRTHEPPPSMPPAPHLTDMPIPDTSRQWNHSTHPCLRLCSLSTMFPRGLASFLRGGTRPPGHTSTEPTWLPSRGCPRRPIRTAPCSIQLERLSSALLGRCPRVKLLGPRATLH